ncbi:MAG: CAP domain-containing protein [Algibacter sp.]
MKKAFLGLTILFLFANISCSKDTIENNEETIIEEFEDTDEIVVPAVKSIETEIVSLINAYRIDNGLQALVLEEGIVKVKAEEHNHYMIARVEISHDLFDARADVIRDAINATRVGENVAYGYITAKDVVDAWIASDGHRENILGDYNYFEISAEQSEGKVWYFTNIFVKK